MKVGHDDDDDDDDDESLFPPLFCPVNIAALTAVVTEVKRSYIELDKWMLLKYFKTIDVLKFSTI
jgi:hypothetical protein